MLSQFSFSNYKSFKNTAFLDMMAESIKDNMESVIVDTTDEERFLPVASIYGPSGGGKSTVLEALIFLKSFLLQQIILSGMQDESDRFRARFISKIAVSLKNKYHRFADELDSKLHPKLLKSIVGLFTNPNTNKRGAQLLLTSHDITTMIPEVFRRDEIWFCAKNPENASKLYSLIAFRKENRLPPRNDEIYGKQYMEGRYGADPYVQKILEWGTVD